MSKLSNYVSHSNGNANTLEGHAADYFGVSDDTYSRSECDLRFLGINAKADDSDLLDGHDSVYFATAIHNHDTTYLGINATAVDSDKLDGHDSAYFLSTTGKAADSDKLDGHDSSIIATSNTIPLRDSTGDLTVSSKIHFVNDDALRYDDATNIMYLDVDGGTGNGKFDNADKLDGHDSAYFLSTTGKAADSNLLDGHDSAYFLSTTGKAADSDKLDGHDSVYFATATHNHDTTYLGINATAVDSDKLDGHDSAYFLSTTGKAADSDKLDGHDSTYFATATHNHDTTYLGINANAVSATKLQTARTISLGGDASGSISFDGTSNETLTVSNVKVDGGSY